MVEWLSIEAFKSGFKQNFVTDLIVEMRGKKNVEDDFQVPGLDH